MIRPCARLTRAAAVSAARDPRTPGSRPSATARASRVLLEHVDLPLERGIRLGALAAAGFRPVAGLERRRRLERRLQGLRERRGEGAGSGEQRAEVALARGREPRGGEEPLVREDAERGTVERPGARLADAPERAHERALLVRHAVRALDPPVVFGIGGTLAGKRGLGETRAFLGVPREPALRLEVSREGLDERRKMDDVRGGVCGHRRRERPLAPIRALVRLVERHADARGEERREADLLLADELRRDHRVEQRRRPETVPAVEEPQVVVGSVCEERPRGETREEGREVDARERVREKRFRAEADLHEADLLEVVVEGIRLRVQRDGRARARVEAREQRGQRGFGRDEDRRVALGGGGRGHGRGG